MKKQIILVLFVLLVLFSVASVSAEDNQTVINDLSNNAVSVHGNTFEDISNAINSEVSGTVYLNNATFTGNTEIVISKNIVIDGASGTQPNSLSVLNGQDLTRIFKIAGPYNVTFKNLVFTNGLTVSGNPDDVSARGSAIYSFNSKSISIYNCQFIDNSALEGGALFIQGKSSTEYSNLIVENCTFINNKGSSGAGAIYVYNANANIKNSNFINNTALKGNATGNAGGAIYNYGRTVIDNCLFENNSGLYAGAIVNEQYTVSINNSKFIANIATVNSGSAIFNYNAFANVDDTVVSVNNSIFEYNVANDKGSGIYNYLGTVVVDNSSFIHNQAKSAALLFNDGGNFNISDSIFVGNVGSNGSVIYNQNCTAWGIFFREGFLTINNSNFNYNVPINGTELYNGGNLKLYSSNLIGNYTLIQNYGNITLENNNLSSESYLSVYNDGGIFTNPLTLIVLDNSTIKAFINEPVTVSAILVDANNNTIGDTSFKFLVNGSEISPILYKNGTYKANVTLLESGLYPVSATINSNNDKYTLENGLLEILPQPNLEIKINNITYLQNATVNVLSSNLTGTNVSVVIKKSNGTVVYNSSNLINTEFDLSNLDVGNYTALVSFSGNENYSPMDNSTVFEVSKCSTVVEIVVDDKKCNATVNGTVILKDVNGNPLNGTVNVTIGNWSENITVIDGKANFTFPNHLTADNYTAFVSFAGNDNYLNSNNSTNFTVSKIATALEVDIPDSIRYDNITGFVYLKDSNGNPLNGTVNVTIEGDKFSLNVTDGVANFTFNAVRSGIFDVNATYYGNWIYDLANCNTTFEVGKIRTVVEIDVADIVYGQNITGSILLLAKDKTSLTSNVTVSIDGENFTVSVVGGVGNFTLDKILPVGKYLANVTFNITDDKYYASVDSTLFNVSKINTTVTISIVNTTYGEDVLGNITLTDMFGNNLTGNVVISVDGKNIIVPVKDGKGRFNITDLNAGDYNVSVKFNGTEIYNNLTVNSTFNVAKANPRLIIVVDNITYGDIAICKVYLNNATESINLINAISLSDPSINVTIDGKSYNVELTNNFGSVEIPNLNAGNYTASASFDGDDNYLPVTNTTNFEVRPIKSLLNISIDNITYGDIANGKITVVDVNGTPLNGTAKVTVDGKTFDVNITEGVGDFKVNTTLNPGNYVGNAVFSSTNYENVSKSTEFLVKPLNITVSNITIPKGVNGIVNITLSNPINTTVDVLFNGKKYPVVIKDGVGSFIIPENTPAGNFTVTVVLATQTGLGFVEIIGNNSDNVNYSEENSTNTNNKNSINGNLSDLKTANPLLVLLLAIVLIPLGKKSKR